MATVPGELSGVARAYVRPMRCHLRGPLILGLLISVTAVGLRLGLDRSQWAGLMQLQDPLVLALLASALLLPINLGAVTVASTASSLRPAREKKGSHGPVGEIFLLPVFATLLSFVAANLWFTFAPNSVRPRRKDFRELKKRKRR